jgi:hypothetical protein
VLGCLSPGQFVPEFQNAADKLPVNVVSAPVKTQFGYHLILNQPWDPKYAANQQIAQGLQQAASGALNARLRALKVHLDPRFGTWGLVQSQTGSDYRVTPPDEPNPRNQREPTTTTVAPQNLAPQGG